MSGSYGILNQKYNTLLAQVLQGGTGGGGGSETLQQVLTNGNTATLGITLTDSGTASKIKLQTGSGAYSELASGGMYCQNIDATDNFQLTPNEVKIEANDVNGSAVSTLTKNNLLMEDYDTELVKYTKLNLDTKTLAEGNQMLLVSDFNVSAPKYGAYSYVDITTSGSEDYISNITVYTNPTGDIPGTENVKISYINTILEGVDYQLEVSNVTTNVTSSSTDNPMGSRCYSLLQEKKTKDGNLVISTETQITNSGLYVFQQDITDDSNPDAIFNTIILETNRNLISTLAMYDQNSNAFEVITNQLSLATDSSKEGSNEPKITITDNIDGGNTQIKNNEILISGTSGTFTANTTSVMVENGDNRVVLDNGNGVVDPYIKINEINVYPNYTQFYDSAEQTLPTMTFPNHQVTLVSRGIPVSTGFKTTTTAFGGGFVFPEAKSVICQINFGGDAYYAVVGGQLWIWKSGNMSLVTQFNDEITCMTYNPVTNEIWIGGQFTYNNTDNVYTHYIARYAINGVTSSINWLNTVDEGFNGLVTSISLPVGGESIGYVGGSFTGTSTDDLEFNNIACLDITISGTNINGFSYSDGVGGLDAKVASVSYNNQQNLLMATGVFSNLSADVNGISGVYTYPNVIYLTMSAYNVISSIITINSNSNAFISGLHLKSLYRGQTGEMLVWGDFDLGNNLQNLVKIDIYGVVSSLYQAITPDPVNVVGYSSSSGTYWTQGSNIYAEGISTDPIGTVTGNPTSIYYNDVFSQIIFTSDQVSNEVGWTWTYISYVAVSFPCPIFYDSQIYSSIQLNTIGSSFQAVYDAQNNKYWGLFNFGVNFIT
jgi:hypothetical protein